MTVRQDTVNFLDVAVTVSISILTLFKAGKMSPSGPVLIDSKSEGGIWLSDGLT